MKNVPRDLQFQCIPKNDRAVVFLYGLLKRPNAFHVKKVKRDDLTNFLREELIHLKFNAIPWDCKAFANFREIIVLTRF